MRLRTSQAKLSKISHSSKFTSSFERTSKFYSAYSSCIQHQSCSSVTQSSKAQHTSIIHTHVHRIVGSHLFKRRSIISVFSFLFAQISGAPFLNGDLAVRIVLSKSPFFVTAYHKFCANIKIERPKTFS